MPWKEDEDYQSDRQINGKNPGDGMIEDVLQPEALKAEVGKEDRDIRGHAADHQRRKRQPPQRTRERQYEDGMGKGKGHGLG